ncbi:MAG: hypothetical protein ACKO96_44630 [Flammeovirgaceae bacterium]
MKTTKIFFLFMALVLPIAIFIFLKLFGKNEFDIAIYYANGVDSVCVHNKSKPYQVPDSILAALHWNNKPTLVTYNPSKAETDHFKHVWEEINQLEVTSIFLPSDSTKICDCVFLIRHPWKTVLIDNEKHIRGYYNLKTREETDRLAVELKILLNKY